MTCNANPAWLEQQTGVAWGTLRKHYGKYMPRQGASEMNKLRIGGRAAATAPAAMAGLPESPGASPASTMWSNSRHRSATRIAEPKNPNQNGAVMPNAARAGRRSGCR